MKNVVMEVILEKYLRFVVTVYAKFLIIMTPPLFKVQKLNKFSYFFTSLYYTIIENIKL